MSGMVDLKEFVTELGKTQKELKNIIEQAKDIGLELKTNSKITPEQADKLYKYIVDGIKEQVQSNKVAKTLEKEDLDELAAKSQKSLETSKISKPKKEEKSSKEATKENTRATKEVKEEKRAKELATPIVKKREIEIVSTFENGTNLTENASIKESASKSITNIEREKAKQKLQEIQKTREALNKLAQSPSAKRETSTIAKSEQEHLETKRHENIKRRMGIRIVRRNDESENSVIESKKPTQSAAAIFEDFKKEWQEKDKQETKKAKKPSKSKTTSIAKNNKSHKIDFSDARDFKGNDIYDDDADEILLFDLHEQDNLNKEEEEKEARQNINDRVRVQRKNPWMSEGGIKRHSKKKRVFRNDNSQKVVQSTISIPEEVRVYEFAEKANLNLADVIKTLFNLGLMVTKNDFLDKDSIEILAEEFHLEISIQNTLEEFEVEEVLEGIKKERPPVVTIMGHVDHGKTSLLDKIRDKRVAHTEAGGITQHIGAYMVEKNNKWVSFIDTPGHEAFSQMRNRGAQVTDIAVIVIAADDGVKQQTIEALEHAKAANVPVIFAMNKMDKENINPDKLKAECAELGYNPVDWGGEYEFIPVSAKTGDGIDNLLETILIQADIMELQAIEEASARAIVLEGSVEKGRGAVATVIVQNGTLNVGDSFYAETAFGKVRTMTDDQGKSIQSLKPSMVALITGLSEVPPAGSVLIGVENDSIARLQAQKRATYLRQKALSKSTKVSFDELSEMVANKELKNIPVIIKADTQGSLEAIKNSLLELNNEEVAIQVIHSGVGGITENDLSLVASSEHAVILGFNIRPTGNVKNKAKEWNVSIKTYTVIYALIEEMRSLLLGLMSPIIEEEHTGQAEVRETFNIPKVGTIAGCVVSDGVVTRGIKVRLIRDGVIIHTGEILSLKRFKDDAKEVSKGYECGIMLENYNEIKVGDVFETYKEIHKKRTL
ncbi:translation initiation factor IF-2 [Helicobacter cetorum]|uniref:Translation initiation factor IF-2 n=1 Tax=Helicobacter cetorum (strain ATCC BAA-540 / CCUG 52418 / MIT 99-5656) TaxID=1163745 RepID=I0EUJ9_HELCM|nr:translation initiation factor IF-2 [Helicobacter cetorum]AFI06618.1 translation initiation factor IF-2 [Helicobacter cetorum MIT 99-5656]